MKGFRKSIAVLALAGSAVGAGFAGSSLLQNTRLAFGQESTESPKHKADLTHAQDLSSVFRRVGKEVEPSVVNIQVTKAAARGAGGRQALPFDDDMLRRFFPDRDGDGEPDVPEGFGGGPDGFGGREQHGTGSGVIMEVAGGSGFILTNNHVAGGATELSVTLSDGRVIKDAKVVGTDPKTDLAVVKINATDLKPAKWGDSEKLERGDFVLAFGSPFGYIGSMTHGIVSALNRQAGILAQQQGYENFIQVDCPINPGNSGGPLTNLNGEVVGINTAIASRSGGFQGIGFAIPSNQAKFVYGQLKDTGKVVRGWLGVSISDVSRDLPKAQSFGFTGKEGVLIEQTFSNTPATGKLRAGDIVTALNGQPVETVHELRNTVAATTPGTSLTFKVFRGRKFEDIAIKIGEQPENLMAMGERVAPSPAGSADNPAAATLGLKLATPTDELVQKYGLAEKAGVVVTDVEPRSPAAEAGLRAGDVITKIGDTDVKTAKEATDAMTKQDAKKGIRFYVTNATGARFVFVAPNAK